MKKLLNLLVLLMVVSAGNAWATVLDFRTEGLGGQGAVINGDEWLGIGIELSTPDALIEVGCSGGGTACVGASINVQDFEGRLVMRFVEPNTTTQSSSLNVNVDYCCEINAGSTDTILYDINGAVITTFTDQDVNYQGGTPVGWLEVDFGNDAIYVIEFDDTIISAPETATFAVSKDFSDDNTSPVDVQISCNAGLPLQQNFIIVEDATNAPNFAGVTFVVSSFGDGAMDCHVTETPIPGYSENYSATGDSSSEDDDSQSPGCHFYNVNLGDANTCTATNILERVYWDLTKAWDFDDEVAGFTKEAQVEIFVENFRGSPAGPLQNHNGVLTIGDETKSFFVHPNFGLPATRVRAVELPSGSAVESDQGCADWIVVNVGDERKSCTITNTVFFEGIPTLSQYGLAILALLILGIGMVAYKRIA